MKKLTLLLLSVSLFAGGKAWMSLGYGTVSQQYDKDGNAVDLNGSFNVMNVYLGGAYDLYKLPTMTFFGGLDLRLSQHEFSPDQGSSISSGFTLQNLAIFAGVKGPLFKGKLGFLFDMGPEENILESKLGNSDEQNAIMVSVSGRLPNPMFSLSAGLSYFLTLETEKTFTIPLIGDTTMKYDAGDFFAFYVKGGYKFVMGEAGLEIIYRMRTTAKSGGQEITDSDGNHLSIIPYVVINPPMFPVSFFIKGAVVDEYLPYGFSVMGKNDYVTRLGFTLGGYFTF